MEIPQYNSFPSSAQPSDVENQPKGARSPRTIVDFAELPSLFQGENAGPPTALPESVSAAQIADENRARWGNLGPTENDNDL